MLQCAFVTVCTVSCTLDCARAAALVLFWKPWNATLIDRTTPIAMCQVRAAGFPTVEGGTRGLNYNGQPQGCYWVS
eukprot:1143137-Pelagomonas_calceolata.AAC.6